MTTFVTINPAGQMTRLRRYEARGRKLCTHEGIYDPETVTEHNVSAYHDHGARQDVRGFSSYESAAAATAA